MRKVKNIKRISQVVNKKILLFLIFVFDSMQGQTYKSLNSEVFLSLDWRSGFFHLYCNSVHPMAWSGTYSQKEDTIFCVPYLLVIDTVSFKDDYLTPDSIRQFVFVEKGDMLKDITRKKANIETDSEWLDSLYITNKYYDKRRYGIIEKEE
jgi:hypothetical protein